MYLNPISLTPFVLSVITVSHASAQHEGQVLPKIQLLRSRHTINNWIIGQPLSTTSGLVDGHPAPNATEVSEYLGIPYAEPPVGDLRFQPPVKYNGTSVINATDFGNSCINISPSKPANKTYLQDISTTPFGLSIANSSLFAPQSQSEDCLTLNIWTKPQTGQPDKAVMIYIHPGGYYSGSSSLPSNNPQWLVNDQDVIVVTFNYRLSIFGYPANPLSAPNLGLLDTRLAIEWVRDNIAEFGGDPSRITLFGQGTGASIADSYSFAAPWADDPIVQAYILMSGTAVVYEPLDNRTAYGNWFNTSEKLGCGGPRGSRTEVWQCMLGKNANDIAKAASPPSGADLEGLARFRPTVDNVLIFGDYTDRKSMPAPVLVGNTDDEAGVYRLATPGRSNASWEEFSSLQFGCPAAWRAGVNVRNGNPTWRYRYFASFPNLRLFESWGGNGAWHGSDILLLFNNTPTKYLPNTAQEIAFGKYFRGAWAAFIQDPFTGLSSYAAPNNNTQPWPEYNLTNRLSTIIRLGWHNQLGSNLILLLNTTVNGTSIGQNGTLGNSTWAGPGGGGIVDYDLGCPTSWSLPQREGNGTAGTGTNSTATATATTTFALPTGTSTPTAGASSGGSPSSGSPLFGLSSSGVVERTLWVGLFVLCFTFFASH